MSEVNDCESGECSCHDVDADGEVEDGDEAHPCVLGCNVAVSDCVCICIFVYVGVFCVCWFVVGLLLVLR